MSFTGVTIAGLERSIIRVEVSVYRVAKSPVVVWMAHTTLLRELEEPTMMG